MELLWDFLETYYINEAQKIEYVLMSTDSIKHNEMINIAIIFAGVIAATICLVLLFSTQSTLGKLLTAMLGLLLAFVAGDSLVENHEYATLRESGGVSERIAEYRKSHYIEERGSEILITNKSNESSEVVTIDVVDQVGNKVILEGEQTDQMSITKKQYQELTEKQ